MAVSGMLPMPIDIKTGKPPEVRYVNMKRWYDDTLFQAYVSPSGNGPEETDMVFFNQILARERTYSINPKQLLKFQDKLNMKMRGILVGWLIEVCIRYRISNYTTHMTINLLDQCLTAIKTSKSDFQLLGATCLHICSNAHDVYPIEASDLIYIMDKAFTIEAMRKLEVKILKTKKIVYDVCPTPLFLKRWSLVVAESQMNENIEMLSNYILDLALLSCELLKIPYSQLAIGALALSIELREDKKLEWDDTLQYHTRCTNSMVDYCVDELKKEIKRILAVHSSDVVRITTKYAKVAGGLGNIDKPSK